MMETIDAATLKTVRTARKVGRPKLAKLIGVTERQISKLESAEAGAGEIPAFQLMRISEALMVPMAVLSGEDPITEADLRPLSSACCTRCSCG